MTSEFEVLIGMEFGENLKKVRKLKGINRSELAKSCGISYVQLSKYEEGKSNPTLDSILKISDALSVSPKDLIPDDSTEQIAKDIQFLISNYDRFQLDHEFLRMIQSSIRFRIRT